MLCGSGLQTSFLQRQNSQELLSILIALNQCILYDIHQQLLCQKHVLVYLIFQPAKVWKIIETQFKLNEESDSEILSKIIKNHLASNGYYPDVDSLVHGNGLKEIVDILDDKIMSVIDLLEKKHVARYQEWNELMQERIIKNARSFYHITNK